MTKKTKTLSRNTDWMRPTRLRATHIMCVSSLLIASCDNSPKPPPPKQVSPPAPKQVEPSPPPKAIEQKPTHKTVELEAQHPLDQPIRVVFSEPKLFEGCTKAYQQWFRQSFDAAFLAKDLSLLRQDLFKKVKLGPLSRPWELDMQLKDPDMTMALAQYALLENLEGPWVQRCLAEPDSKEFFAALLMDRTWLESFMTGGLLRDKKGEDNQVFEAVFALQKTWQQDPSLSHHSVTCRLASAMALACTQITQGRRDPLSAKDRYLFFKDSWLRGRLYFKFDQLNIRCMRFLVNGGDIASLRWAQDNIRIPLSDLHNAYSRTDIGYTTFNSFGRFVQVPGFMEPWEKEYSQSERVWRCGAVCGGLSNFGSTAAISRGIPSQTIRTPGHCAYSYLLPNGTWERGFSSKPEGMKSNSYGPDTTYRSMADDMYRHDLHKLLTSHRHRWQAICAQNAGSATLEGRALERATEVHPMPYEAWLSRINWLTRHPEKIDIYALTNSLTKSFGDHPKIAFDLVTPLEKHVAPDDDARLALWRTLYERTQRGWDKTNFPKILQLKLLGEQLARLNGKDADIRLAEVAMATLGSSRQGFPHVVAWSQKQSFMKTIEGKERFVKALLQSISNGDKSIAGSVSKQLGALMLQFANSEAMETFQFIGKEAATLLPQQKKHNIPKFTPFPGQQLSRGGLLRASSTSRYDHPLTHHLVLDTGGQVHTDRGVGPWVLAQLPRLGKLSGIVVTGIHNGSCLLPPLIIEVSEDKKTWTKVATFNKIQSVYRADLSHLNQPVRYIRVRRGGDKSNSFCINGIFAYGERQE